MGNRTNDVGEKLYFIPKNDTRSKILRHFRSGKRVLSRIPASETFINLIRRAENCRQPKASTYMYSDCSIYRLLPSRGFPLTNALYVCACAWLMAMNEMQRRRENPQKLLLQARFVPPFEKQFPEARKITLTSTTISCSSSSPSLHWRMKNRSHCSCFLEWEIVFFFLWGTKTSQLY